MLQIGTRQFRYLYTVDDERIAAIERVTGSGVAKSKTTYTIRGFNNQLLGVWQTDPNTNAASWVEDEIYRGTSLLERERATRGTTHYFLDHLGSPRAITSATGALLGTQTFNPWQTRRRPRASLHRLVRRARRDACIRSDEADDRPLSTIALLSPAHERSAAQLSHAVPHALLGQALLPLARAREPHPLQPRLRDRAAARRATLAEARADRDEADRVLAQPDITTPFGLRDRAMLEVLYSTGMRRSELAHLSIYDVDPERGVTFIRQGKGKKDCVVPIGDRALAWLQK